MRDRELLSKLAGLGCVVCGGPAQIHHSRAGMGIGMRAGDDAAYPLCAYHHLYGPVGDAVHKGRAKWEERHGAESEHIKRCQARVGWTSTR